MKTGLFLLVLFHITQGFCQVATEQGAIFHKESIPEIIPKMYRPDNMYYRLDGKTGEYLKTITKNWLLGITERNPYILDMYKEENKAKNGNLLPWSGEFAGKYLTNASAIAELSNNTTLKAYLNEFVDTLISYQTDTGYLGPWPKEYELTNKKPGGHSTWDSWNHYHLMIGLLQFYEMSKEEKALKSVVKIAERLYAEFYTRPDEIHPGYDKRFNLAPAHALAKLYNITRQDKYLMFAEQIVKNGFPQAGDYYKRGLAGKSFCTSPSPIGTRWEQVHAVMALAELYWATGKTDYKTAFENIWWGIAEFDCHNTGGFTTNERAGCNQYKEGWIEACCSVAWQVMTVEMLKICGYSVVADVLEYTYFNALRGAQDISGKWSTYHTGMRGKRRPNTVDIAFQKRPGSEELNCCSVNVARGFGHLKEWVLMKDKDGLVLNWYEQSAFEITWNNVPIKITITGDYPQKDRVDIEVLAEKDIDMALKLRIPFWSKQTKTVLNGSEIIARPGQYLEINKKWQNDKITLHLDMSLHLHKGAKQCKGLVSIYRGPILLAYNPETTVPKVKQDGQWKQTGIAYQTDKAGAKLTIEFNGHWLDMLFNRYNDAGQVKIEIDGNDMGIIDLYGPEWGIADQKRYDGLGNGQHTAVVSVLEEKNPKSKNNMVRLYDFRNFELPVFDAKSGLEIVKSTFPDDNILIHCRDINGDSVQLRDFDSAGAKDRYYYTWLKILNVPNTEFNNQNPLASGQINRHEN